jgi:hypothetical protein
MALRSSAYRKGEWHWREGCWHFRTPSGTTSWGSGTLRLPARLAFVTEAMGRSAQEFVIELHELAVMGWHAEIGGGLESTSRGVIERSTLRTVTLVARSRSGDRLQTRAGMPRRHHRAR